MAYGTTLGQARRKLKALLGYALEVNSAEDARLNQLLLDKQVWCLEKFDWPTLWANLYVPAPPGTQYLDFPVGFDRLREGSLRVVTGWGRLWYPLEYGIEPEILNALNNDPAIREVQPRDPIMKWQSYGATQFEIWPTPVTAQTIWFKGQRLVDFPDLDPQTNDYPDTTILTLDDNLLVLTVAAPLAARDERKDAMQIAKDAETELNFARGLCAVGPSRINMGYKGKDLRRFVNIRQGDKNVITPLP